MCCQWRVADACTIEEDWLGHGLTEPKEFQRNLLNASDIVHRLPMANEEQPHGQSARVREDINDRDHAVHAKK